MSRINTDNYDEMTIEQLREAIRAKHGAMNEALTRNQHLETMHRRMEDDVRSKDRRIETLETQLKAAKRDVEGVAAERANAQRLAALLYEKLMYLSDIKGKKPSDVRAVVSLYRHALEQVSRITMWPELTEMDFFARIFTAAEERVFGTKKVKKPVENPREFIERSVEKQRSNIPPGPQPPPRVPGPRPVG